MKLKIKFQGLNSGMLEKAKKQTINRVAVRGIKIVQQEIRKRDLINTGNMLDSVGATKTKNTVSIQVGAGYAGILNDGVKQHRMKYLQNVGPIPIITKTGQKIFRVATEDNMKEKGSWVHPGFKRGKKFFDVSINKISDECEEILSSEIAKTNKR
jgi:hypothetical protein